MGYNQDIISKEEFKMLSIVESLKRFRFVVLAVIFCIILLLAVACSPTPAPVPTPTTAAPVTQDTPVAAVPTPAEQGSTGVVCTPSGQVKRGGELTLARLEEPLSLDPIGISDNGSIYIQENVFEALVEPDETGEGLTPGLAESWEISDDGLVYTFTLRDAIFSNGNPVTAADAVFSLQRAADPAISEYAFAYQAIQNIEEVDSKTVRITLSEPYSPLLSVASLFTGAVVPKDVYQANPDGFGNNPVGSGPFVVERYTRGDRLVLIPNPYYWKLGVDCEPLPYLDKITVRYVPESTSRVLGLRNRDFHVIDNVPFNEAAALEATDGITLRADPIYKLDYLYINHSRKPFDNKDFRLALNYATDRQAIFQTVFFGFGELPNSFMPKMNFHDPNVPLIPYDPDKARELLAQTDYAGESIEILVPAGDAPRKQMAVILQQNWREVGINADILELDIGTAWDRTVAGDYDLLVSYITSDINDDDELATFQGDFWAPGESEAFFSRYQSKEVADLLAKARQTSDPSERANYYSQAQETAYWDGYSIAFNFTPAVSAHLDIVKNWRTLTTGWWWLENVWLDQ
jgi:peptide/nickel transport system substrate-binding protein